MNLFSLFSKLYYVTKIRIILDLLFYNYLQITNLNILIKSFHINRIKIFTLIELKFYKYFTYNYN